MKKIVLTCIYTFEILIANSLKQELNYLQYNDIAYIRAHLDQYKSQCENGNGNSCQIIGSYYKRIYQISGYKDREIEEASLMWFIKGCNLKSGSSCYLASLGYGNISKLPTHLPKDEKKTFELHKKGCDYGHSASCNYAGYYYEKLSDKENDQNIKNEYQRKAKLFHKKANDLNNKKITNK